MNSVIYNKITIILMRLFFLVVYEKSSFLKHTMDNVYVIKQKTPVLLYIAFILFFRSKLYSVIRKKMNVAQFILKYDV
jgi:hypothetical protein